MQRARLRSVLWLPGPALALLLVGAVGVIYPGPGLFLLLIFAAAVFLVVVPILQIVLLSTPWFRGKYAAACGTALFVGALTVFLPALSGVFDFY